MNINELQNRITELEKENEYLKALLDNAGISYNTNPPYEQSSQEIYDENQGGRIIPVQILIIMYGHSFLISGGRMDVFSKRYQNKSTGKAGYPRLDTLVLATPVAWKGIVEQYAGRLNRDYDGKDNVMIYDYVDIHIPVFDKMYAKRLKAYKRIGYQLYTGETLENQASNSIFDSETYLTVYEKDLKNAAKDIVISSPTLGKYKVHRMISLFKERHESGVKVTIVTWHPEIYKYGKDEYRIELMELLRNAGFHIELMTESCQHYAIIDGELVWYGSMNLLSKDDVEDNIMRVSSKAIAAELLEMTFKKDNDLNEYQLPLNL